MRPRTRSTPARTAIPVALAVLALAGCDDAASPGVGQLTEAEAAALSVALVEESFEMTGDVAVSADAAGSADSEGRIAADPITVTTEFTRTRTCPVSGQVVIAGMHVRVWDRETHTGSSDLSLTKTHEACARVVEGVTLTVSGDPDIAVNAHHEWEGWRRHGLQTVTMVGGLAWTTADGREGSCTIDVSASFDPETRTRTVTGTFCNRTFDRTTTWTGGGGMGGGGMGG